MQEWQHPAPDKLHKDDSDDDDDIGAQYDLLYCDKLNHSVVTGHVCVGDHNKARSR